MGSKQYKVLYTYSSRNDIRAMKKYILDTFKYHELGESFTKKIKDAVKGLKLLPSGSFLKGHVYSGPQTYNPCQASRLATQPMSGLYRFFYMIWALNPK